MGGKRPWFASGGYKHLDVQIGNAFAAKTAQSGFVTAHSWLPLIKYIKRVKRYKPNAGKVGKTVFKDRTICTHHTEMRAFSSVSALLDKHYTSNNLSDVVIAYRKLGKANYHFSADAFRFAKRTMPCMALCFDISGFFDHLDHRILKDRLKRILNVKELSSDWYSVFRAVTKYCAIERSDLENHPIFGRRFADQSHRLIATIAEINESGIQITSNPNKFGIPQGTPISSPFSNLYLLDFDAKMLATCVACGALYQRYSDDVLVICPMGEEAKIIDAVQGYLIEHHLELAADKTDVQRFDPKAPAAFQYLGFNISPSGAVIRQSSLARQWRKAKRAINAAKRTGAAAILAGKANKIFVSSLRRRFSPVGSRNFSSYARRADAAFGAKKISRQVAKLERRIDSEIRALQNRKGLP
jgi:RNA-directed DNA polymerase